MTPQSAQFDVYLTQGCATPPSVSDVVSAIPALNDPLIRSRLLRRSPGPGFLGVQATADDARQLLARLKAAEARGEVVPAAYRQPPISTQAAQSIAERALAAEAASLFPGYTFRPTRYWREGPRWWVFGMISDQLVDQGHVPGGVLAYVDKVDGHIWQPGEMQQLAVGQ